MKSNYQTGTTKAVYNLAHSTIEHPSEILFVPDYYDNEADCWQDLANTVKALASNGYDMIFYQEAGVYVLSFDFSEDDFSRFTAQWIDKESLSDDEDGLEVSDATKWLSKHRELLDKHRNEGTIKKCPICGCTVYPKQSDNGKWYMDCGYCPLKTEPIFDSQAEAIDYWNDRE